MATGNKAESSVGAQAGIDSIEGTTTSRGKGSHYARKDLVPRSNPREHWKKVWPSVYLS
ncbi:conserved hypothetical protein [Ricinus communis]|uniref:Uncharacterized protein n=1 Tax=Ricinus communis TaxID=3988 RepID=B9SK08_RICCO|nr:conserved hypothetical protein [Ricinus communis]